MSIENLKVYGQEDGKPITLVPHNWYAWQMLPGYGHLENRGYFSPIWVTAVRPLKTGADLMELEFFNACYARGGQDFSLKLKVLSRRSQYLMASLPDYKKPAERDAVISRITPHWLLQHCPHLCEQYPPEKMQNSLAQSELHYYLNELFFRDLRPENGLEHH